MPENPSKQSFSQYEKLVIAIIALTQFTVVLDFMVLSPLGTILMDRLAMSPRQFSFVVSGYAFSAGISGVLASLFADKFDRKNLLLFFYGGFILGTLACGLAQGYSMLLAARIFTGVFGGVISSISFAIIADIFPLQFRGRVMGFVQMAFSASQVLGIPIGLYIAGKWDWHLPFLMIVAVSLAVAMLILFGMKPVREHLDSKGTKNPFEHVLRTISNRNYLKGFAATVLLATGGYMLMPFGSDYSVHNLGLTLPQVTAMYLITGVFSMGAGPLIGMLADSMGKYRVFLFGSALFIVIVLVYCNLGITPFWLVTTISVVMFIAVTARIISSQALITAVPGPADRGAFMSINSAIQQVSGGFATIVAGLIIFKDPGGQLHHYDILGFVVTVATLITLGLFYIIHRMVRGQSPSHVRQPGGR